VAGEEEEDGAVGATKDAAFGLAQVSRRSKGRTRRKEGWKERER